jgi:hypothetical protein
MKKFASALNSPERFLSGRCVPMLLLAVMLGGMLCVGGCSSSEEEVAFPTPPPEVARKWYFDVYGTAANDIYVSGNLGVMYHYNGTTWTIQDMGTSAAITTIWSPDTETTLYAVGHKGRIWRNSGSGWSGMDSGTTQNLYGIGSFQQQVHAVGANGTIRRLNGSSWGGVGSVMFILDENAAPTDTLVVTDDLSSVLAVNHYFVGGAYFNPRFAGIPFGINNTKGMVLAPNEDPTLDSDWILRPISGEERVQEEWVLAMTSDSATLDRNYLGTSEGWLFRLIRDDEGKNVWQSFYPDLTGDPFAGIRDIWLDANGNVYMVTDEGKVIYQTVDYNFTAETGRRDILFDGTSTLVSVWGTGPDNLYFTGYYDEKIFHAVHDPVGGTFTMDEIDLLFPADKAASASSLAPGRDEIGRPLR